MAGETQAPVAPSFFDGGVVTGSLRASIIPADGVVEFGSCHRYDRAQERVFTIFGIPVYILDPTLEIQPSELEGLPDDALVFWDWLQDHKGAKAPAIMRRAIRYSGIVNWSWRLEAIVKGIDISVTEEMAERLLDRYRDPRHG